MLFLESFLSNKTLKPLKIIAKSDNQITRFDSISCGFLKRFVASIINKTATIISAAIGSVLLFFYAHGVLAIIDRVR